MPKSTLTLPTIHMNGTGRKMLTEGYDNAAEKLDDFINAFSNIEFSARDYYVQSPEAYPKARDERTEINQAIKKISSYLLEHRIHLHS